jgi:hypothetical protein
VKGYEPIFFQSSQVGRVCTATVGLQWPDGKSNREAASSEVSMSEAVRLAVLRAIGTPPLCCGAPVKWADFQIDPPVDIETEMDGQYKCIALVSVFGNLSEGKTQATSVSLEEAYFRAVVDALNQAFDFAENKPESFGPKVGQTIGV